MKKDEQLLSDKYNIGYNGENVKNRMSNVLG
ncbi:hypothetical protein NIES932_08560 [Raphidiopsis curvata NIES-932]|nr:hypothetical protein NIES932_08560 [Raphidiopsis curvata NIES-932]